MRGWKSNRGRNRNWSHFAKMLYCILRKFVFGSALWNSRRLFGTDSRNNIVHHRKIIGNKTQQITFRKIHHDRWYLMIHAAMRHVIQQQITMRFVVAKHGASNQCPPSLPRLPTIHPIPMVSCPYIHLQTYALPNVLLFQYSETEVLAETENCEVNESFWKFTAVDLSIKKTCLWHDT